MARSVTNTTGHRGGTTLTATTSAARLRTEELMEVAAWAFRVRCAQDAVLATVCAELDRREDWRTTAQPAQKKAAGGSN
jgi:hypothetical protein